MNTKLTALKENIPYLPGSDEFVILPENSIEEVLVHLLSEMQWDKEGLLIILETMDLKRIRAQEKP